MAVFDSSLVLPDRAEVYVGAPAPSHLFLEPALADGVTTVESRTAPGLTWVSPDLEPRPILIGPSTARADLRPALAIGVDRFRAGVRNGYAVARARMELDDAVLEYALSPSLSRARAEAARLAEAAQAWSSSVANYAEELAR
jgi:hypothetical protein